MRAFFILDIVSSIKYKYSLIVRTFPNVFFQRHPSNLMLDQMTGKVLHIDFGDCFEVAMQRDKFPEKVPFRLTRMLTKVMDIMFYFLVFA